MQKAIAAFDKTIIQHLHRLEIPIARTAIFVVYFWFGILKLFGISPATPLVQELFFAMQLPIPFEPFYILFSFFEMTIGVLFLVRGAERLAIFFITLHLFATIMPLFLLPAVTWQGFMVPTLEGQYIIKNILIAASAVIVGSKLVPLKQG